MSKCIWQTTLYQLASQKQGPISPGKSTFCILFLKWNFDGLLKQTKAPSMVTRFFEVIQVHKSYQQSLWKSWKYEKSSPQLIVFSNHTSKSERPDCAKYLEISAKLWAENATTVKFALFAELTLPFPLNYAQTLQSFVILEQFFLSHNFNLQNNIYNLIHY